MLRRQGLSLGTLALVMATSALAVAPPSSVPEAVVPLPTDVPEGIYHDDVQLQLSQDSAELQEFRSKYGRWNVFLWDERTELPQRAYGQPIQLVSGVVTEDRVVEAGLGFIDDNPGFFGVTSDDLRLLDVRNGAGTYYVTFQQQYEGIDVFDGRVLLRVDAQGRLIGIGSEVLPDVAVLPWATLSESDGVEAAKAGLSFRPSTDTADLQRLVVLPVKWENETGYFLTYEVDLAVEPESYKAFVDARSGDIVWRKSMTYHVDFEGTLTADVVEEEPTGPQYSAPVASTRVYNAGSTGEWDYTFRDGSFQIGHAGTADQTLSSRFVVGNQRFNINNQFGADGQANVTATPGVPVNVHFDDSNSIQAERVPAHHLNEQRWHITDIDATFPFTGGTVSVLTQYAGSCNAQWSHPGTLRLFRAGSGCIDMGDIPSVAAHEYGHGLTHWGYTGASLPCSLIEAFPDGRAMFHTNHPTVGTGWQGPGTTIRTGENTLTWAQALAGCPTGGYPSGECHCKADVTMGAIWKMRANFMARYGDVMGEDDAERIFHYAIFNRPSTPQAYLLDVLAEDDMDGDLGNGSPNWDLICDAFAIHGLPCPSLDEEVFIAHTQLGDTISEADRTVTATITADGDAIDPSTVFVRYRVGGDLTYSAAPLNNVGGDTYEGDIPGIAAGNYVEYYIEAASLNGAEATLPDYAPGDSYLYAVGVFVTEFGDQAESDLGWTIGAAGDDATDGLWTRDDPNGTTSGGELANPEDDHTAGGINCYFTGQGDPGGGAAGADLDGGCTTLTSPLMDISDAPLARLSYWRWTHFPSADVNDLMQVDISTDDGASWMPLETLTGVENSWTKSEFLLFPGDIDFTNQVRVRFVACDQSPGAIVEAGVDDFLMEFLDDEPPVAVDDADTPVRFHVHQNRPNPFNPVTTISYEVPAASKVTLNIFNVSGQLVRTLVDENVTAGAYSARWDGRADSGLEVASGIYYYEVTAGDFSSRHKMTLLK